jgi:acetyl esterase/lipase
VVYLGVCTAFAVAPPRRSHSGRFSAVYWFGLVVNEIPVLALALLAASTLLALFDGNLASVSGVIAATLAAVVAAGLICLTARGFRSASKLRNDVMATIGPLPREQHAVRALLWPFPMRPRNVKRTRNIAYGAAPGQRLDVYRTASPRGPTLVYFHGGAFRRGDKSRQARPLLQTLAQRGWVCISANYPLRTRYQDQLASARAAVAWARATAPSYGADPDRVLVAGSSAGAHLAATASFTDPTMRGTICLGGYFGFADSEDPESSPIVHVTAATAPFLVIHGENDTIVIIDDAREFVTRLREISPNAVVYGELAGAQHSFDIFSSPRMEAVIDAADAFGAFATHLE